MLLFRAPTRSLLFRGKSSDIPQRIAAVVLHNPFCVLLSPGYKQPLVPSPQNTPVPTPFFALAPKGEVCGFLGNYVTSKAS